MDLAVIRGPQYKSLLLRENSTRYTMPQCHFVGVNYWVLKTTYQNRGVGIHVFRTLYELNQLMIEYISEQGEIPTEQNILQGQVNINKNMKFIIQKYIERPLLINKRKFDIRVWVLIN